MTDDPTNKAETARDPETRPSTTTTPSMGGVKPQGDRPAQPGTANPAPGDPLHRPLGEKRDDAADTMKGGGKSAWTSNTGASKPGTDASGEGHKGPRTDMRPSTTDARAQADREHAAPPSKQEPKSGECSPNTPLANAPGAPIPQGKPMVKPQDSSPAKPHGGGAGSM